MRRGILVLILASCSSSERAAEPLLRREEPTRPDASIVLDAGAPIADAEAPSDDAGATRAKQTFHPFPNAKVVSSGIFCPFPASTCPDGCDPYSAPTLDAAGVCAAMVLGCVPSGYGTHPATRCLIRVEDGLLVRTPYASTYAFRREDGWTECTEADLGRWREKCPGWAQPQAW